jgi:hypothetical protein
MVLLRKQSSTLLIYDDQGPALWGNYVGNWIHHSDPSMGLTNNTITSTPEQGASFWFAFTGAQVFRD